MVRVKQTQIKRPYSVASLITNSIDEKQR